MSVLDSALFPLYVALGALSTGEKIKVKVPFNFEIVDLSAPDASVAPAGSAALIDVEIDGTSIMTTRFTIADAAVVNTYTINTTETIASNIATAPNRGAKNSVITLDVDQVGSGTAGTLANVTIWVKRR